MKITLYVLDTSKIAKKYIFGPKLDAKLDATISRDSNATIVRIGSAGMP